MSAFLRGKRDQPLPRIILTCKMLSTIYSITINRYGIPLMMLGTCVLYGCASSRSMIADHHLTIDKIPSKNMQIDYVYVANNNRGTEISGTARFNRRIFGTPSDNLVVTIIDQSGKVLDSERSRYYLIGKPNRQRDIFRFSLTIPDTIPNRSIIRLNDVDSL